MMKKIQMQIVINHHELRIKELEKLAVKKLQVLLGSDAYKDIYVPSVFTSDDISAHCEQLFGVGCSGYREYREQTTKEGEQ